MTTIRQAHVYAGGAIWRASDLNDGATTPLEDLAGRNGTRGRENSLEVLSGASGDRYIRLPQGTTAQRPASPRMGYLRFNTTIGAPEFWDGAVWHSLNVAATIVRYTTLNANGDVGTNAGQISIGNHTH